MAKSKTKTFKAGEEKQMFAWLAKELTTFAKQKPRSKKNG